MLHWNPGVRWALLLSLFIPYPVTSFANDRIDFALPGSEPRAVELGELPGALSPDDAAEMLARGVPDPAKFLDASKYHVTELAAALEYDPVAAFEYVRDQVRLDPYNGLLRGSQGVLAASAGGPLDRSLLLMDLLEQMAIDARLVFGPLPDAAATRLLEGAMPARGQQATSHFLPDRVGKRVSERARRDYSWLVEGLSETDLGGEDPRLRRADVRDHVWVQARLESDWTDFDTSFAEAQPGESFAVVDRIAVGPAPEQTHRVTLSVKAEKLENGDVSEVELLTHTLEAHSAQHDRIFLVFVSAGAGLGATLGGKLSPESLMAPAFLIDEDVIRGRAVPGVSVEMSETQQFFFGSSASPSTALYLDVHIDSPGKGVISRRRVLYDRVDPRQRISGEVAADTLAPMAMFGGAPAPFQSIHQILVSTGGLSPHAVLAETEEALDDAVATLATDKEIPPTSTGRSLAPLAAGRANWQLTVEEVHRLAGLANADVRLFVGEPQVAIMSVMLNAIDNEAVFSHVIDLLHDRKSVLADDGIDGKFVAHHFLWHGALQSALETVASEFMGAFSESGNPDIQSGSRVTDTNAARLQTIAEALKRERTSHALLQDIEAGRVVLVPADGQAADLWWAVDPATGVTVSRGSNGLGYSLLPVWFKKRLTTIAKTKVFHVDIDELDAYARRVSQKTNLARKKAGKQPARSTRSRGGGGEYPLTLEISSTFATTSGEILGYAIGLQMLSIITMLSYGVAMDRY